ncbi:MAG TPA: GNAT family N-acetyltransferase [Labilithrix sp.]|nr:GNAT family N-acetyltransferase [Labilithrix sp.]
MSTSDAVLRSARVEDAEELAALARTTFIETFVDGFGIPYPAEDLKRFLDRTLDVATTRDKLLDTTEAWWVVERNGELVAFANTGPTTLPHPEARSSHAELRRLYVARNAQGLGLGTRLLETALEWMEAHTDGPLWIGVWSGNLKAQKLYERYGFHKCGEYKYPVGSWYDDEFILRRPK